MEDKLFSMDEVSKYLKISKSTIYKLSEKGELPSSKIGKQLRFRKSSIDNWLSRQEQEGMGMDIDASPQVVVAADVNEAASNRLKNILLVDDDELVLTTVDKLLKQQGYNVEPASNAQEALRKARKNRFDLIIVDMRMPDMDGIETLKRIRSLNAKRNIPAAPEIVITGYMDTQAEREAQRLGVTGYVHKPFAISEFIKTVKEKLK